MSDHDTRPEEPTAADDRFPDDDRPAASMIENMIDSVGSAFGVDDAGERVVDWVADAMASDGPTVFDNYAGPTVAPYRFDPWWNLPPRSPGEDAKRIGRSEPIEPAERIGVCVHQTAVRFGTTERKRAIWRRRIEEGELDEADLAARGLDRGLDACAARLALHERFWRAAYHWVGLLNGDVVHNNPITRYTYHGNGSNRRYLGIAAEGELPARESGRRHDHDGLGERFIETNRAVLASAVDDARRQGASIEWVTAHRCWSPRRRGDPGELYWKEVVLPMLDVLELRVDYELAHDGGRPIPTDWDPAATHDWSGRVTSPSAG
jgi:hypothetical protein